ncbi:hypothetical protein [Winogradskyella sp. UBA3174]|uniref:hypothetical protein n=1 Tax=Winogradskyella sp. UBA3174 TaxID=1947785 RepID=UPI0025D7D852|nr:hypothetical protein [Winogradskyella sp. UBA3174]|tara:strand:- start:19014 stop:21395 length:2382 start_codon:yes stop_codon:yes gene_type:complete
MKILNLLRLPLILILFISPNFSANSQEDSDLVDAYEDYTEAAREIVYAHLNKSTYIKGEDIGFTAYVLDKKDKKPSLLTTNLYISVSDANNTIVKEKLIRVDKGVAINAISLDSTFSSGYYTFKAYTNWMLNFDEQNYYTESIRIIDPAAEEYVENAETGNNIDAQFLPESGHILNSVVNNVGVIIKDKSGLGIPNLKGEVLDKNNVVLSEFTTNQFGISKFQLLADINNSYRVKINYKDADLNFKINQRIKPNGIILSLKRQKTKAFLSIITNDVTLEKIRNKRHTLLIHNGDFYEVLDVYFNDKTAVTKIIDFSNCPAGTNILTLFNEEDQPIAERLFFNHQGINIISSDAVSAKKQYDSLTINLSYKTINPSQFNSLSISVLPEATLSYKKHHNILSHTYLQPYVNGSIERGKYYFTNVNEKKKYELDDLLLTQGWSSYSWDKIYSDATNQFFPFEQGITLKANVNGNEEDKVAKYMLHATPKWEPTMFEFNESENAFFIPNIFISETDKIYLSRLKSDDGLLPAKLYLQSIPSRIPALETKQNILIPNASNKLDIELNINSVAYQNLNEVQQLEEVLVVSDLDKLRIRTRELGKNRYGTIKIITDEDRYAFYILEDYLRANRVQTETSSTGEVTFFSGRSDNPMMVYLNDQPLMGTSMLYRMSLNEIDYIEINRSGIGGGIRGNNGELKLYTINTSVYRALGSNKSAQVYTIPLTFSEEKKFYVPKYKYYDDPFYKGYGIVDWKPQLKLDENGTISIKIKRPKTPITLFIEGIANDGSFVFEEKSISLN